MIVDLSPQGAGRLLAAGRLTVGTAGWLAPRPSARALGISADRVTQPGIPLVFRLFASRDIVLGVGLLGATGPERDRWLVLGMAADAADAAAAFLAGFTRQIPRAHAAAAAVTAIGAVALGAHARR